VTATGEPNVTVAQALVESETVPPGTLVTVTAVVENVGSAAGSRTVPLVVNGVTVSETTVELAPGETQRLTFERRFQNPGTVTVAVGEATAGQLTVGTETATRTASPTTTDTSFPGFGPLVAALAVFVAALLARRRE
jgi:PGF-CTERM protein